jgi:hypothetical protein
MVVLDQARSGTHQMEGIFSACCKQVFVLHLVGAQTHSGLDSAQLISFCFFWANITAISFIPNIRFAVAQGDGRKSCRDFVLDSDGAGQAFISVTCGAFWGR